MKPHDWWFYFQPRDSTTIPPTLPLYPGLPGAEDVETAKKHGFVIRILDKANGGW